MRLLFSMMQFEPEHTSKMQSTLKGKNFLLHCSDIVWINVFSKTIMVKHLRFHARFLIVSILLNNHGIVKELIASLTRHVNEYISLKPADAADWQAAIQEITLFLQVCLG